MNDTTNRFAFLGGLVVAAVVLPLLLGAGLQWPTWGSFAAVVVALVGVAAFSVRFLRPEPPVLTPPPSPAPPPPPPSQATLEPTSVRTAAPDYQLQVSATVYWQSRGGGRDAHEDPDALAKSAVLDRAASALRELAPSDHALAGHRLAATLGIPRTAVDGRTVVWATDVVAAIAPEDANRLAALERLRKDNEVWLLRRDQERDMRRYLSDDVLTSPGSAVVWWLARHLDEIDGVADRIDPLTRISAVAQGRSASDAHRDEPVPVGTAAGEPALAADDEPTHRRPSDASLARNLLDALFPEPHRGRGVAVQQLARLAEHQWNRGDLADEIRRIEDVPYDDNVRIYVDSDGEMTSEVGPGSAGETTDDGPSLSVLGSQATDSSRGDDHPVRGPQPPDLGAWPDESNGSIRP
ncbi:hypothetical protein [Pseudonocardia kunmingensis]|uniref:Uncharacterized protein n=1 Tax=Pseudonocardia kunmingensis TaxID=630975 RepID=A0A543DRC2_9PSEU|nr:hypothetical protein [Pseudonocardia kunmingensis]TQM11844.1 hypothetical protein FB558_4416 [Pseudonocardia kunmingensis]